MTITEEVNLWIMFWMGSAFVFVLLFCLVELYYYLKNKKQCKDKT